MNGSLCWEMAISACTPFMITPFQKPAHGNLSSEQHCTNALIAHYWSRIEYTNWRFNCHAVFHTAWRGGVKFLHEIIVTTAHCWKWQQSGGCKGGCSVATVSLADFCRGTFLDVLWPSKSFQQDQDRRKQTHKHSSSFFYCFFLLLLLLLSTFRRIHFQWRPTFAWQALWLCMCCHNPDSLSSTWTLLSSLASLPSDTSR